MSDEQEKNNKIAQLKCELFDIVRQQEALSSQFNQLNTLKMQKVQELQKLEQ